MKPAGQQKLVLLMSVVAVLCSLSHGCPLVSGEICVEDLPNANLAIRSLSRTLQILYRYLENAGFEVVAYNGPVCVTAEVDHSSDLDSRMCQYSKCLQQFRSVVRGKALRNVIENSERSLLRLVNIIQKMMEPTCTTDCTISWTTGSWWSDMTKGRDLTKELIDYLEQLNISCSS